MIPCSSQFVQGQSWQQQLQNAFQDVQSLLDYLDIPLTADIDTEALEFKLRVPVAFADKMQRGCRRDPLLLQVLPLQQEHVKVDGFSHDPLGEDAANASPGLLHKYHGRALVMFTGSCAINCRYCFRRHFPYQDNQLTASRREEIITYVASDPSITEIILSGGDPLLARDHALQRFFADLAELKQIKRLRIHSRIPIVLPARITSEFLQIVEQTPWQTLLVVHCNHMQEIGADVAQALSACKQHFHAVYNQAVLLRGINDNAQTLVALSEALFALGVQPYYLHLLDKVAGSAHFLVEDVQAQALMREVAMQLPGYLVPKLVREVAGQPAKQIVAY
jgi:L-lysine 2,3-aminomutase